MEDETEDFVVDKVLIYLAAFEDEPLLDEYVDEWPTGEIEAELMEDHLLYQLKLEAMGFIVNDWFLSLSLIFDDDTLIQTFIAKIICYVVLVL